MCYTIHNARHISPDNYHKNIQHNNMANWATLLPLPLLPLSSKAVVGLWVRIAWFTRSMPNDRIQSFGDHFYFILLLKRTYFYKLFLVFLFALWHLLPEILNKQLFNLHVAKCNTFFYNCIISSFFDIAQYPHILRNLRVIPLSPKWARTMPEFD